MKKTSIFIICLLTAILFALPVFATTSDSDASCAHSYGDWTPTESGHQKTCIHCGDVQTEKHFYPDYKIAGWEQHKAQCSICNYEIIEDHHWGPGELYQSATCKEEGVLLYPCAECSFELVEFLPILTTHTYGPCERVDADTHIHSCTVCEIDETLPHSWDNGTVTKPATCKEEGILTVTCTDCGESKTEVIPKSTDHTFGSWTKLDESSHKRSCTVCQLEETGAHGYKSSWSKNAKEHWHECSDCKYKKDLSTHVPGKEATEYAPQTCTVCQYLLKATLDHTHKFAQDWTTDETNHWHTCAGCDAQDSFAEHDFENDCDADCSTCGYTRDVTHTYGEVWESDSENHWHVCTGCGKVADQAAHIPGAEATETAAQTCTLCNYEIAPVLEIPATDPPATEPATEPAIDDAEQDGDSPLGIVIAVTAVIGCAGAALFILRKKK